MSDESARAGSRRYPVKVITETGETTSYSPAFQTEEKYAEGWKAVLRKARSRGSEVICGCPGDDKHFSVHYVTGTDSYHLAKYPGTGHLHAEDCLYYSPEEESGETSAITGSKRTDDAEDQVRIRLDIGIRKRNAEASERTETAKHASHGSGSGGTSIPTINLVELLETLWLDARLNVWTPKMEGKRNPDLVHWLLLKAAEKYRVADLLLSDVMLACAVTQKNRMASNAEKVEIASKANQRIVVVAPLAQYKDDMERRDSLPIYGFHGIPMLKMDSKAWADMLRRQKELVAAWKAGAKIEAIIQADVPHHGQAHVLDMALFRTSANWIPLQSDVEARIEEKLVAEKRSFVKPLKPMGAQRTLPAFRLSDTDAEQYVPLVVMDIHEAPARARYYENRYGEGRWWSWNGEGVIPEFPKVGEL